MNHAHPHEDAGTDRRLVSSLVLTMAFVVCEGVAGYLSHSLALISDAGHNFADALALALSWYAVRVARRPATARRSYGFHRVGILAALANAGSLVVIALLILWEGVRRLQAPPPVESGLMIGVAGAAVVINTAISVLLHREARHDLNIRSAYLHMVGDAISGLGVVAAGVVVAVTGAVVADPLVSLLIAALILWSSWSILAESVDVLLEAAPAGLDLESLEGDIGKAPGVLGVHDLHVWTIGSGVLACSCHIVVAEQMASSGQQVLHAVAAMLDREYGIEHSTVQVEVEDCRTNGEGSGMRSAETATEDTRPG